ncbi:MAG: hypothetical protein KC643_14930 [Nitrospira sp.]|nr:hypothetical protein [Nitrospira sp.]MCB9710567.1 hypothetical protein [Nitrospiraceae bacterium]
MATNLQIPSLYFVVVFWGKVYRENFLELLLPSLLSPKNLPSLPRSSRHQLLIVTTLEDWVVLQSHPNFLKCQHLIDTAHLCMDQPSAQDNKYLIMSQGHRAATRRVFADRACGVFLTPDLVLSDGSVSALYRLASEGKQVVLCAAMRFALEPCLAEIQALKEESADHCLILPARKLAGLAMRSLHMETMRYDYDAPFFAERPISFFFRTPDQSGMLVHSFSWAPLLVNYGSLVRHSEETFQAWTMDGDYIYQNFQDPGQIYVVQDSDEILLVSFTPQGDFLGYLPHNLFVSRWYLGCPLIKDYWKVHLIRLVRESADMDPLKRRIVSCGVRIHSQEGEGVSWDAVETRSNAIMRKVNAPPSLLEKFCVSLIKVVEALLFLPLSKRHMAMAAEALATPGNQEFTNQAGAGTYRMRLLGPKLSGGKWYWELSSKNLTAQGGALRETACIGVVEDRHSLVRELGAQTTGWGWRGDGKKVHAGTCLSFGTPPTQDFEVIMVALDMTRGALWFGRNGEWFESGDPEGGRNPAFTGLQAPVFPALSSKHGGQGTATLQSRVTSDQWVYVPPMGFQSLVCAARFSSSSHSSFSLVSR